MSSTFFLKSSAVNSSWLYQHPAGKLLFFHKNLIHAPLNIRQVIYSDQIYRRVLHLKSSCLIKSMRLQRRRKKHKDRRSIRSVPLCKKACDILQWAKSFDDALGLREYVFSTVSDNYNHRLSEHAVRDKLEKLCRKLNIPRRSPDKFRKTFRTTLIESLVMQNQKLIMGHKPQGTGRKHYDKIKIDSRLHFVNILSIMSFLLILSLYPAVFPASKIEDSFLKKPVKREVAR